MLLKYAIHGNEKVPALNSKKIDGYCNKIISELNKPRDEHLKHYERCKSIVEKNGLATKDRLKRALHTTELRKTMFAELKEKK